MQDLVDEAREFQELEIVHKLVYAIVAGLGSWSDKIQHFVPAKSKGAVERFADGIYRAKILPD